jgi:hypothetical protein
VKFLLTGGAVFDVGFDRIAVGAGQFLGQESLEDAGRRAGFDVRSHGPTLGVVMTAAGVRAAPSF